MMFYVMRRLDGVAVRHGRMYRGAPDTIPAAAVRLARQIQGWVEGYGRGPVWTPRAQAPGLKISA
jgi:hypothetical protein